MDTTDAAILRALKQNGRATASQISREVNLSIPAVAERIRKLEERGIIQQYTVKINRMNTNQRLLAFILVNIDRTENVQNFRTAIVTHSCVLECHHIAGSYDYLLKVALEDTQALETFLSKTLKQMSGVSNSNTMITLKTLKEDLNTQEVNL